MFRWNQLLREFFASPPQSAQKATKHGVRLILELLEGRELLSADPIAQVMAAAPAVAAHAGSAIAGASLDSSSDDTDGSGTITGGISGTAPGSVFINNGVISGDPGGPGATFNGGCLYVYEGKDGSFGGQFLGSGTLGDGTTFSVTGDDNSFTATVSGNTVTGTYQASGTNSEDDDVDIDGTFQGTVDGNGNVTGGTFTCSINVAEPLPNNDVLVWNPKKDNNASNEANWYDLTWEKQGVEAPTASNPVIFDGTADSKTSSNSPITWDVQANATVASITLRTGYNALQTINGGLTVEDKGTFTSDAASNLNVQFGDKSVFQIDNGGTITNMKLAGFPTGQFNLSGGTTTICQTTDYKDTIGVNFTVAKGASLTDYSNGDSNNVALQFTNNNLLFNINGTMTVHYSSGSGNTLIDNNGFSGDYLNVSGGTLTYIGTYGAKDTFTVPVFVQQGGSFAVTSYSTSPGGTLIVKDSSNYVFPNGSKESVYMQDASNVKLSQSSTLECDNDYYQANGMLATTDTTTCTLQDGPQSGGTATIAGGSVTIAAGTSSYGELDLNAANVNFNGTLIVAIAGNTGSPGKSDVLKVSGTTNLQAGSSLTVYVYGQPVNGNTWIIIQDGQNNNIQGDFKKPITTNPATNLNAAVNAQDKTKYILSF